MKFTTKNILIVVAALVVFGGLYWYYFAGSSIEPSLTASGPDTAVEARFTSILGQLQPISFDTSIFSDARFAGLVDLATPITPEGSGRIDPFAPISGVKSQ